MAAKLCEVLRIENVHRQVPIPWIGLDYDELRQELAPYLGWIATYLASGDGLPTHIEHSGSIAVPLCETTTPEELFAVLGPGIQYSVKEYEDYWVTVHYPNPEPVVTLLPKRLPDPPPKLLGLCEECSSALGAPCGGPGGMFLAWLLPGFSWAMHTDHDNAYEQIASRIHVPLITSPLSLYVWGRRDEQGKEEWILTRHLERDRIHYVRVDVPHTVVNGHESEPRLHLILDVHETITHNYATAGPLRL